MRIRKLNEDEINAMVTLLQSAENIGTGYWSDEQARSCILDAEKSMPTSRAKDEDIGWTIKVLESAKKLRDNL